jgi:integrase/recombinase XerD
MKLNEFLEQTLQPQTVKIYQYEIDKYLKYNPKASKYNYKNVMKYIESIRVKNESRSIKRIIASIKKYYEYLIKIGKRKDNPAGAIRIKDGKEKPIQIQDLLNEKELESLLKPRNERYPFLAKRNQVIMSLLVYQGLRVGEMIQLKINDVNLEKTQINITGIAHTKSRILPLKANQILLFHEYLQQSREQLKTWRTKEDFLLLSKLGTPIQTEDINYLISTYQKDFKKKFTTITIRQSVIANLLTKNNDLRIVQEFAGHKHLDTTEKYRETGLNALKTAIDKLHPIQ